MSVATHIEVVFIPELEALNQLLLGIVDGLCGELSLLLGRLELVESLSVLFLQFLELLQLVELGLVDHFVLAGVARPLNEPFSAGVDVGAHGGG